jgi:hypothetical protein
VPYYLATDGVGGLAHLFWQPEGQLFWYGIDSPLILAWVGPLVVMGLFIGGWQHRWWLLWAVGGWIAVVWARPLWPSHATVLYPLIALCVGQAVMWLSQRWPVRWQAWAAIVLLLTIGVGQSGYYFGQHLPQFNRDARPYPDAFNALWRASLLPDAIDQPPPSLWLITHHQVDLVQLNGLAQLWGERLVVQQTQAINADWVANQLNGPLWLFVHPQDNATQQIIEAYGATPQTSPQPIEPRNEYILYILHN